MQTMSVNYDFWRWILGMAVIIPEAIFDILHKQIHPYIVLAFTFLAAVVGKLLGVWSFIELLANMIPGLMLLLMAFAAKDSIGKGDGLICLLIGQIFGLERTILILIMSFVFCSFYGLFLILVKRADKKTHIAFVPFLLTAIVFSGVII